MHSCENATKNEKDSDERPIPCETCGLNFACQSRLNRHRRVQTGEKPHVCDICKKCFSSKSYLKVHFRTHINEKPFSCSICS